MRSAATRDSEFRLALARLPRQAGIGAMWQVVGAPFRVVALDSGWLVVALGDDARKLLARHDLLATKFRTRAAAVSALSGALARE